MKDDAGADEKCRFRGAVADKVERSPAQSQRRKQAEADSHQAHMADGGKSQQALEMALAEAHQRSEECSNRANGDQQGAQLANMRREYALENAPIDASNGIEPKVDHNAGKKNANRRRSDSVSIGQPEMKGNQSSFHGEAAE